ncbi:MAG: NUDIX hydrolase [Ruminiclostridium sp.]|nr:NUDIX hydrolase [Ruminiclostridium sp.]
MTAEKVLPAHVVAAAGVIRNDKGEILLVKNIRRGWEYPGGMVENGENIIEGLQREIFEETGASVKVGELFCVSSNTNSYPGYNGVKVVPTKLILDFICTYEGGELRASDENSETRFVPEADVLGMVTEPVIIERFGTYLEYSGRPHYLAYKTKPEFISEVKTII